MKEEKRPLLAIATSVFTGDLADLLRLARKRERDLRDVSLSDITRQVLEALDMLPLDDVIDVVAEGAVVAAQLVLEKTRVLIGEQRPDPLAEELELEDLARQAAVAQERAAIERLVQLVEAREVRSGLVVDELDVGTPEVRADEPLVDAGAPLLRDDFADEAELEAAAHTLSVLDLYPQAMMTAEILALSRDQELSLERFRDPEPARFIAAFMALLELVKSRTVRARQAGHEILVSQHG